MLVLGSGIGVGVGVGLGLGLGLADLALALQQLRPELGRLPAQGVELRAQRLRLLLPRHRAAPLLLQVRVG